MDDDMRLNIDDNMIYAGVCYDCDVIITPDNDSGWDVFTPCPGESQRVCQACWDKRQSQFIVRKTNDDG
jgi:hypothetical protein